MSVNAQLLIERLGELNGIPHWQQAARLGVELVDHPDSTAGVFHLADGDVVYPTTNGWATLEGARTGIVVGTGSRARIHVAGVSDDARVHPTARVDPTACVEAGAKLGPHAYIGPHAHVGRDAIVFRQSHIAAGAYVGPGAIVRGATHIGSHATVGAGSDLGTCTRLAEGTTVDQATVLPAHTATHVGEHLPRDLTRRSTNPWRT